MLEKRGVSNNGGLILPVSGLLMFHLKPRRQDNREVINNTLDSGTHKHFPTPAGVLSRNSVVKFGVQADCQMQFSSVHLFTPLFTCLHIIWS